MSVFSRTIVRQALATLATITPVTRWSRNRLAVKAMPSSADFRQFLIRAGKSTNTINVFDQNGSLVFIFERTAFWSSSWIMLAAPSRAKVAKLQISDLGQSIEVYNSGLVWSPKAFSFNRMSYRWTRDTMLLVQDQSGGTGSAPKKQVASVQHLRPLRFDWQVLVDSNFDSTVAIVTAFAAMLSEWCIVTTNGRLVRPTSGVGGSPAGVFQNNGKNALPEPMQQQPAEVAALSGCLLAYDKPSTVRDFFNPPFFFGK